MANKTGTLVVEELLIMLGLESDDASFDKAKKQADTIVKGFDKVAKAGAVAASVVYSSVALWVNQYADAADSVGKLARRINSTVEEIQELDYVAEKSNLTIEFMRKSIEKLNSKAGQASTGNKDLSETFKKLGIDAKKFSTIGAGAQMEMLADSFARLPNEAERSAMALKLFEEEGLAVTTAFEGGSAALRQMREDARKMGLFSTEDAKRAEEYQALMVDTKRSFTAIRNEVGAKLLPELTKLLKWFKELFLANREIISSGIVGLFTALGAAMKILASATALWISFKLGSYVIMAAGAMRTLTLATLAANAAVILIPMLIGLAIAAIAILAQDIYGFFTGADSLIGRFAKRWPIIGVLLNALGQSMYDFIQIADGLLDILVGIVTLDWSKMETGFMKIFDVLSKHITTLGNMFKDLFDGVLEYIPDFLKTGFSSNVAFSGGMPGGMGMTPYAATAPSPTITNSTSKSQVNQDNRVITVSGADIAEVKRILREDNAYTAKSTTSGIER